MGTKHTPGPWSVGLLVNIGRDQFGHSCYAHAICFGNDGERVADFVYSTADARLVAASPRLLEALRKVLREAPGDALDDWYREAELAVAEAEGRSCE